MKVLLLNGSTRKNGCTWLALSEIANALNAEGMETEILQMGVGPVRDCIGCNGCAGKDRCVFEDDLVNELIAKAKAAEGFVFGSPVYYAHPSGQLLSLLDRLFYAGGSAFAHKPGAAVVTARRAGTTASLDVLNKHMLDAQMPIVSSTVLKSPDYTTERMIAALRLLRTEYHFNGYIHAKAIPGTAPELVERDAEGLQTMRNLGRNMAWLLKCIYAGREKGLEPPAAETAHWTNFNR